MLLLEHGEMYIMEILVGHGPKIKRSFLKDIIDSIITILISIAVIIAIIFARAFFATLDEEMPE